MNHKISKIVKAMYTSDVQQAYELIPQLMIQAVFEIQNSKTAEKSIDNDIHQKYISLVRIIDVEMFVIENECGKCIIIDHRCSRAIPIFILEECPEDLINIDFSREKNSVLTISKTNVFDLINEIKTKE